MAALSDNVVLVAVAFPAAGHTQGLMQMTKHLVGRGFRVYFIGGVEFKSSIEKTGAEYVENPMDWRNAPDLNGADADIFWAMKHIFADSAPTAFGLLRDTLERVRQQHPDREVLILHEAMSLAVAPFKFGAPLPKGYASFPKVINFHPSIYVAADYDTPPFGPGLPYDPTPENKAIWRSIYDAVQPKMEDLNNYFSKTLKPLGATNWPSAPLFDTILSLGEVTLLATTPSLEYPIAASNPKLRFLGGLPLKPLDPSFPYPEWWPEITSNAALPASSPDKKKLVFITQGTVHRDYSELVIPALAALSSRRDLIVVATLGFRGQTLPDDVAVPDNARVIDYLPYDAILPHADVFVSNAGYGGFMHGVMNGVPMVLSGTVADKAEVSARAEWVGIAVNLRAQRPSAEAIRDGVDKVLGDSRYKARAVELKRENEERDALGSLERIIEEVMGSK